ncbi:MAG: cation diffusion facilitator family transporter [Thiohalobacterales bacterium]|nr:cation diffusion facilitator family transporter [Thiohalobacterales bacterium]
MGHTHLPDPLDQRYSEMRKVTLVGAGVDLLLGVAKLIIGVIASSQALIADGIHSLSDLATDFLVLFAAKHAHREADEEHPYGHGRIETVATVALGVALVLVAVGICYDAARRMLHPEMLLQPGVLALWIAALSVVSKEVIYQYTARVARRLRSKMLLANAWHSRSDAISSIVVVIGVGGAIAGVYWLDAVAAIAVALMIAKIGWELLWKSLQELIDTALEPELVEEIRQAIFEVGGVRDCHMLRTRHSGSDTLVDVHIIVDPLLSVSEGHQIGEHVRLRLIRELEHVADVTVHIDPEDDETARPSSDLPLRAEVMDRLQRQWQGLPLDDCLERVVLHYLAGRIHVDVYLLPHCGESGAHAGLAHSIRAAARQADDIGEVNVYCSEETAPKQGISDR